MHVEQEQALPRTRRFVWRWITRGALVGVLSMAVFGCDRGAPKNNTVKTENLDPVPAPAGLAAEMILAHPNTVWASIRNTVGGPLLFMPASYPMLVASLLGLPPTAAEQVDADVPTLGAATSDGSSEAPVLAIHVKNGKQLELALTSGPEARYTAKQDASSGVTLLEPKAGQGAQNLSLGVIGNYLLVAPKQENLLKVGPYAARTLSTKPAPKEGLTVTSDHDALAGPLRTRLSVWWGELRRSLEKSDQDLRDKHGGSTPTFGDPKAALQKADTTFQGILSMMTDLSEGKIQFTFDESGAHIKALLKPMGSSGIATQELAAMRVGDASTLLDLPANVSIGLMMSDSPELRERSAKDQGEAIEKVLAGKLSDAERKKIQDILGSWSKGRGDQLVLGGYLAHGERSLFARSTISDMEVLDKGIRSTFELTQVPALAEPLTHWLGELKLSPVRPLEGGIRGGLVHAERKVPQMRIDPETGKAIRQSAKNKEDKKVKGNLGKDNKEKGTGERVEKFDIVWSLEKEQATYVIAPNATEALRDYNNGTSTLRSDEEIKTLVSSLGNEASFVLLLLPMRLISGMMPKTPSQRVPPAAPILLSLGKNAEGGWFRLDAVPSAVRELAKIRPLD